MMKKKIKSVISLLSVVDRLKNIYAGGAVMYSKRRRKVYLYVPGEQPSDRVYIKLNANENPYPPVPDFKKVISDFDYSLYARYPDPECGLLSEKIAKLLNVEKDMVFCGNGSDEVLSFVFYAFFDDDKPLLSPEFSYSFYPVYSEFYGIPLKRIPLAPDYSVDLDGYLGGDSSGVIFANPNAPTGINLSCEYIRNFLTRYSGDKIVVVDEAYVDFGGESVIPLLKDFNNLVVLRTFSKSGSFAGGRLGFAVSSPENIGVLKAVKNSFNHFPVDILVQKLGITICENWDYYKENALKIAFTRDNFSRELKRLGFDVLPSKANFVFVKKTGIPGKTLYEIAKEEGFLIRYFDIPGIRDFVRISVGTDNEMEGLIEIFKRNFSRL